MNKTDHNQRCPSVRLALRRDMTFGEIFRRWPKARLLAMRGLQDVDQVRDANVTLEEYARRFQYGWAFESSLSTLNNCLVLLENADGEVAGDPTLVDYALFHGLTNLPSPETTRKVVPCRLDAERLGLLCDGGLPYLRWVLSDGLNAVRLQEDGPAFEMLTCFQRVAGMCSERIFDGGFLDLRVGGQRHPFDQVHLTSFGYENHLRSDPRVNSSLLLCGDRLWLSLAAPGQVVQWVLDESKLVTHSSFGPRCVLRHGWDAATQCLLFTTIDERPNRVGERPAAYEKFTDEEVVNFVGTEWPESIQGAKPMHTECWVALGPAAATTRYAGSELVTNRDTDRIGFEKLWGLAAATVTDANAVRHTFAAQDAGGLVIGIGSTRAGALAELQAAREGAAVPRQRQIRRYETIRQRAPRLEVEGHPLLDEITALIPQFLESLKTGFALMRSRPHTGAVCGGWDQMLVASPMVRAGDWEMTPRYLEHWLHQIALDGQIFHVSDVDLGPACLLKRWDFDDFMYLLVAAQWIAGQNDRAMLERLAAKCTHMLRVMLAEADESTGFIACRGIFPDFPPMECARTGITYPAMEIGTWYEALRWWEGLTLELGEHALHARIAATAEKIRSRYSELFVDAETGMIWDAVRTQSYAPVRTFCMWALTPFQGAFGHELFAEHQIERLAQHLATRHIDLKFPYVKMTVGVETPYATDHMQWPVFDHLVGKALRRGQNARGVNDLVQIIERHYQWMHTTVEAINAYDDLPHDLNSQFANWFGWSATAWYEVMLSAVAGIQEEPGGLVYACSAQTGNIHLHNLPYRGGVWDIQITGAGRYVDRFEVDGQVIPGICKVPDRFLTPGAHRLVIHRAAKPPGPLILDSVGLKLMEATPGRWQLAGPGRALIRFYSPSQPTVRDRGQVLPVEWDQATGIGHVMIHRHAEPEELEIQ